MKASIMAVVIGALIPTVFLCSGEVNKKIKKTENIHEHYTLAIVEAHRNSKRNYVI
ncbi:MAG: hypothetical protein ACT4OW_04570 [Nitrososphaerota archaeon]